MCEDVARTVHLARQLGEPLPIAPGRHRLRSTTATRTSTASADRPSRDHVRRDRYDDLEVWFLTGSQALYGDETLRAGRRASPREIAAALGRRRRRSRSGSSGSRCSPTPTRSARPCLEANADDACVGVIAWMHTFSPAKMWIAGLDALRKPLLHLHTQANVALPWSTIDMDFMNLNQAAHGDREFGYIQTRLGVAAQDRRRARRPTRGGRRGSAPWARAAAGRREPRVAAAGPVRRQHARRRGDRGRQGRGAAAVRRLGQHLRRQRPGRGRRRGRRRRRRRAGRRVRRHLRRRRRSCARAATGTSRCATRARIELGLRHVPRRRRLRRVHHQLRGPRRAAPAARASPCSG